MCLSLFILTTSLTDTDILYLNVAGTSLVVLDTSEAATELLEKRSSNYSGRSLLFLMFLITWYSLEKQSAHANDERADGLELPFLLHALWCVICVICVIYVILEAFFKPRSTGERW
jgi:hypothetical protein